jgi:hypothetical protein
MERSVTFHGVLAEQLDTSRPHPARIYDYYLGGRDNYEVDRAAAEDALASVPRIASAARANRAFMHRAVRMVVRAGIRQIIDIGTGIPASPNTHEVAQSVAPETRVAYLDNDPIVKVHAEARLIGTGNTAFDLADVRDPESVLSRPAVRSLIDLGEPVALLLLAVLHFVTEREDPARIVKTLCDALPSGSCLVLTHATKDTMIHDASQIERVFESATATFNFRPRAHVLGFFEGFELVEPGLVTVAEWRPDPEATDATRYGMYGAVGYKP